MAPDSQFFGKDNREDMHARPPWLIILRTTTESQNEDHAPQELHACAHVIAYVATLISDSQHPDRLMRPWVLHDQHHAAMMAAYRALALTR
jgi:hypothetical protein